MGWYGVYVWHVPVVLCCRVVESVQYGGVGVWGMCGGVLDGWCCFFGVLA